VKVFFNLLLSSKWSAREWEEEGESASISLCRRPWE